MNKNLQNIANEKQGFSFGESWRYSEDSLVSLLPILRKTSKKKNYLLLSESEKAEIRDTGNINRVEIYNGDIGRIVDIDPENQKLIILFDKKNIEYEYNELDELTLAYAISVHKSQGSEYPAVILPLLTQHYIMLQRNLIYTAITRGKKLVVVTGSKKALQIGIKNDRISKRYTQLSRMIKKASLI